MFDFMAEAQTAHQMQQDAFNLQNHMHQQAMQQHVHNNNSVTSNSGGCEVVIEFNDDFDKEWEAHRREIQNFDINDFSTF